MSSKKLFYIAQSFRLSTVSEIGGQTKSLREGARQRGSGEEGGGEKKRGTFSE